MKELLRKIIIGTALVSGLGELAASQIHILASTKLFAVESGFYLFLFIIFGMTTGFNAYSIKDVRSIVVLIGSGALAAISGGIYMRLLQADVNEYEAVLMEDVQTSFTLVMISIVIYVISIIALPILSIGQLDQAPAA